MGRMEGQFKTAGMMQNGGKSIFSLQAYVQSPGSKFHSISWELSPKEIDIR